MNAALRALCSVPRGLLLAAAILAAASTALAVDANAKEEAVKKDRKQIEGVWRVAALEVNGDKVQEEDARKITVVNGSDGTWSLRHEGEEVARGTSVFDPTVTPKTIDFTLTEGEGVGNTHLGIYELGEKRRKLCFAPPGQSRPSEFSTAPGSEHIFVIFEREEAK